MFKHVFTKLLFTYTAIILGTVVLLAGSLSYFFNFYFFNQKQNTLLKAGQQVQKIVLDSKAQKITAGEMYRAINNLGYITDSRIYVLDSARLKNSDPTKAGSLAKDLQQILQGKTIIHQKHFVNDQQRYVVFVGMPIKLSQASTGIVLLFSPVEKLNLALHQIYTLIWGTACFSVLAGTLIILFISWRISRPIKNIQQSAVRLAEGFNTKDIPVIGQDEIAELTQSFNYMKNRLHKIEAMRKDLIANVSHELRTPLTSIKGFIQAILDGVVEPKEHPKYLTIVFQETTRLHRLVDDLLHLARLQTGNIKIEKKQTPLQQLIEQVIEQTHFRAQEKNIVFQTFFSTENLTLNADRDKLQQILLNLVDNTLKYSLPNTPIRIEVLDEKKWVQIKVQDFGPGISADELPYIFTKFHRAKDTSRQKPGTGLGLAIAKELVELHGGKIWVESTVHVGTTFFVRLPK
ncbi:ATP-binding protein [Bacillota bacterium LX-D]|nr:ATP-binding protein [Bacillota bacterium LX-D]